MYSNNVFIDLILPFVVTISVTIFYTTGEPNTKLVS
jgi:hypothetical protein